MFKIIKNLLKPSRKMNKNQAGSGFYFFNDHEFHDHERSIGKTGYGKSDYSRYHVAYFAKGAPQSTVYTCKNTENFNIRKFQLNVASELNCSHADVVVIYWKLMSTQEYSEVYEIPE